MSIAKLDRIMKASVRAGLAAGLYQRAPCALDRPLLAYVKSIQGTRDLAQVAWNFINDSLRTTICLQAVAAPVGSRRV
eukprot:801658-Pleurochrysis_carterae.AAC.3